MVCKCFSQQTSQALWIVHENLLEIHETKVKNCDSDCLRETEPCSLGETVL